MRGYAEQPRVFWLQEKGGTDSESEGVMSAAFRTFPTVPELCF